MGKKRVLSVGNHLPGPEVENIPFSSDRSMLDGDVVLFEPSLGDHYTIERYQGKPLLGESSSAELPRRLAHWIA